MPDIRLPDGSIRSFAQPLTVAEVAASIGTGLAKAALGGRVDGKLVDSSYRIEADCELAIITDKMHSQVTAPGYSCCYAWGIRHLPG
jgi:threonyl-tRNA synthetase